MTTVEQAKTRPLVKASRYGVVVYREGSQSNGGFLLQGEVDNFNTGDELGVLVNFYILPNSKNVGVIQLKKPKTICFTRVTHGLCLLEDIQPVSYNPYATKSIESKTFFCTGNGVKIRKTASSTGLVLNSRLNKGDIVGESDGLVTNGFLKFDLAIGGTGYVAKELCTLQQPFRSEVTKTVTKLDPMTGREVEVQQPIIPVPSSEINWNRTVITAIIGTVVSFIVSKLISKNT